MNANLSCFSVGVQTSAEIEELSLRAPRPVEIYLCESEATATTKAAHRTPPRSSALRESDSYKCFICAKAKRQQQMFSVAKAKRQQQYFICAKAKRQQQYFICAKAKRQQQYFICAKAKRQQQQSAQSERKSTTSYGNDQIYKIFSFSGIIERKR
ncbi:hypothetical protein [Lysinibacillus xylanilyticus]|uniref:hypothetical protein n=1 Tax=Lysinibacillus xylanilyticus TaxID=582475 RepID=UPI003CFF8E98